MFKKAVSGFEHLCRPGLQGVKSANDDSPEAEELGKWFYLVTDSSGIRPRQEPVYSKEAKEKGSARCPAGAVLEVTRRRRSGWTRWLCLEKGNWVFDVSPKDRKVRLVEVEVQQGPWVYEVCVSQLAVLPHPQLGQDVCRGLLSTPGDLFTAEKRVRPLLGRGAFLKIAELDGWVLDFAAGMQVMRRWEKDVDDALSPCLVKTVLEDGVGEDTEGEFGEWKYIVLDPKGVTLRSRPTYDKGAKLKSRLEEGEIVEVLERREGDGTVFLRVEGCDGVTGWAFTQQPGVDSFLRLLNVEITHGKWYYQAVAEKEVALRNRCCLSERAKVGMIEKGQLVNIRRRLQVGNAAFYGLLDGTWISCPKDSPSPLEGPLEVHHMFHDEAEIRRELLLRTAPIELPWSETKQVLLEGSKVLVIRRARIKGEMWMEVMQLGGLSGWMPASDLVMDNALSNKPRCR